MIAVELIEAETSRVIATSQFPPEQLPETFEARTHLTLGEDTWEVVRAEPMTRAEYVAAGSLRIFLRKVVVEEIDVSKVLFSMPTICDEVPAVQQGTSKLGRRVYELHEDDWRQLELISAVHEREIREVFAKIDEVVATQRAPSGGFHRLHIRKEVAAPLTQSGLTRAKVQSFFPEARAYEGLGYFGIAGTIEGGFALELPGQVLYGAERGGVLDGLCLSARTEGDLALLAPLMKGHGLVLVDWCRRSLNRA
ncbi:MAG: hypothetical protein QM723_10420 [Myxococcaceae bacterium]